MIYAASASPRRAALRGPRRGPLPAERLPGPGVGGGHHPRPARGRPGLPVGHGVQRRGAGRLDPHRAGRDRRRSSRSAGRSSCTTCTCSATGRPSASSCCPTLVDGRPNPEAARPRLQDAAARRACGAGRGAGCSPPAGSRWSSCSASDDMLPAIYFIFSRAACDDAVAQCVREGRRLTTLRGAAPDPGHRRGATSRPCRDDDLRRPRLRRLAGRARSRLRRPPRRAGPAVQGGGRGLLRRRPGQGRVRHRDPLARDQHAGPLGGHREADQVHRRAPRVPHAGGVHPAHRPGRPAGDRRGRLRRRAVVAVRALRPGGRPGRDPDLRPDQQLPADLQHGRQPGAPLPARRGPPPAQPVASPSTGPTATWSASRPSWSAPSRPLAEARAAAALRARATSRSTAGSLRASEETARQRPSMTAEVIAALERVAPGRRPRRSRAASRGAGWRCCPPPAGGAATSGCGPSPPTAGCVSLGPRDFPAPPRRGGPGRPADALRAQQRRLPAPGGLGPDRPPGSTPDAGRAARAAGPPRRQWRGEAGPWPRPTAAAEPPGGRLPRRPRPPAGARPGRPPGPGRRAARAAGQGAGPSPWPASSTGCCGCSRPGATWTAGRSPTAGSGWPGVYHEADLLIAECIAPGPARRAGRRRDGRPGLGLHLRGTGPGRADRPGSRRPGCGDRWVEHRPAGRRAQRGRGRGRAAPHPPARSRASSAWPTPGRRARTWPR